MKLHLKSLFTVGLLLGVALPAAIEAKAQQMVGFEELRAKASAQSSVKVDEELLIEGYIISDPESQNRDQNFQRYFQTIKDRNSLTFYVEWRS